MNIHKIKLIIYDSRKLSKPNFSSFLGEKYTTFIFRILFASDQFILGLSPCVTSLCHWPPWQEDFIVTNCNPALLKQDMWKDETE